MSFFSKVDAKRPKTSVFNLSHESKLSMNFGDLVPILCMEALPSDRFKLSTELLIKLAPLKAPMMHRVKAYVHFFFVPTYQVNSIFADFINPKVNLNNQIVLPSITPYEINLHGKVRQSSMVGSLADYLGLPVLNTAWMTSTGSGEGHIDSPAEHINIDPFRVYQHIYNEYYRDETLENVFADNSHTGLFNIKDNLGSTSITGVNQLKALLALRKRAWAKDYFTSALPSPQAGDDVLIPMQMTIDGIDPKIHDYTPLEFVGTHDETLSTGSSPALHSSQNGYMLKQLDENAELEVPLAVKGGLFGRNGTASINDLRRAMALQRFKELAERGGSNRYSEMVRNFFGQVLKDYWVDRPIFLGGQVQNIQVGEVVQTSATQDVYYEQIEGQSYLGERGGIANSYGKTRTFDFKCPCHGYIMGILSIRPEATYQQGLERMWTRKSIFDFAFPQFAQMGEQEIYNRELFATGTPSENDGVFGYTPRYAEYKVGHTHVCGEFRNTLNYWHLGRVFNSKPTLSKPFVQMDNPSYAAFIQTDSDLHHCFVDLYNKISARRPLPYFGTPSIL